MVTVVGGEVGLAKRKSRPLLGLSPRESDRPSLFRSLLLRRRALTFRRASMMILHPLLALGLHLIPLLLLCGVEQPADLVVGGLTDLHHLGVAILSGKRTVLLQALHLRLLGLQGSQHFRLLIGGEVELFGQFGRALGGIRRTVVVSTVLLRGRGLLAGAILSAGERRRDRNKTCRGKNEQGLFEHRYLLIKSDSIYTYERNYEPRVAQEIRIRTIFA